MICTKRNQVLGVLLEIKKRKKVAGEKKLVLPKFQWQ